METIGMTDLDTLIAQTPSSRAEALDGLEDGVWNRVAQTQARSRERKLRVAALCVAAGIGGVAGGVSAPAVDQGRSELTVFSPRMAAAPLDMRSVLG
ncbi:MAG: hypothetical protein JHC81_06355 [Brevundimonas sp.]|jgi:hypothetical protein|nr:hypothetical protein [Brevundimonas sp.]MBJ7447140.1 hypothetical protein [Brevundimonas sp.]